MNVTRMILLPTSGAMLVDFESCRSEFCDSLTFIRQFFLRKVGILG